MEWQETLSVFDRFLSVLEGVICDQLGFTIDDLARFY